jgi:hypothetical protein
VAKFMMIEREHICHEETWFHLLAEKIPSQRLKELNEEIQTAINNAPLHAHPGAPATGATIIHPIVGTIERGLDYIGKVFTSSKVEQQDEKP